VTTSTTKIATHKKIIGIAVAAIFWIGLWQLAAIKVGKELLLPSPLSVLKSLYSLADKAEFWYSALFSLSRIFFGIVIGISIGTILAVLTKSFWLCDAVFSPFIRIIRATPVASFIILALLWIGKTYVPSFISMLMVIPVLWGNVSTAISETPRDLLEMARAYKLDKLKIIFNIYIPSIKPSFISSCITSMGLAWKAGIAAEVLCLPRKAIGTELYYSKVYLETSDLFAWTIIVIILSFIFEKGFLFLAKRRAANDKA